MAIWVRLPQLPIEFYDRAILEWIVQKIGKLLKVDACTSFTIRGRYARICVQVELGKPIKTSVILENHKQQLVYEVKKILYKVCGCLGHVAASCQEKSAILDSVTLSFQTAPPPIVNSREEWKTVLFSRKRSVKKFVVLPAASTNCE